MGLVLGIETSCDETSASIVLEGREVKSNVIASQVDFHRKFNGVVPEIASRKHIELISGVVTTALKSAEVEIEDIEAVATTLGPGLVGALLVGGAFGKALAWALKVPFIGVNHLEGHIASNFLNKRLPLFPWICLIVSGGHVELVLVKEFTEYEWLGSTLDDAAGEAFDKVAKLLGLPYPGGPHLEALAKKGNPNAIHFPRSMKGRDDLNFSFSGLKTAVLYYIRALQERGQQLPASDIAASFQQAVIDILVEKTMKAVELYGVSVIALSGGVSANQKLRETFDRIASSLGKILLVPPLSLCTDNAAMIASAGYFNWLKGKITPLDADVFV